MENRVGTMLGGRASAALALAWLVALGAVAGAQAEEEAGAVGKGDSWWPPAVVENRYYALSLDARARLELADFEETLDTSQAWTLRLRYGIGTRPFHGLSAYAEGESILAADEDAYFDVVSDPNGRTPIADPTDTELNQLFGQYQNEDLLGLLAKGGRQRIVLDDQRFIGNVGWRQNEQTFDAALGSTTLGVDGLRVLYAYLWDVRRIFGDQGEEATEDFESDSHLVNVSYAGFAPLRATAFAYLLDFRDSSPANSSNSYGVRLDGSTSVAEGWTLGYAGSWAWQTDAGRNPVDYEAHYLAADGRVGFAPAGAVGVGYERLGSDDGEARFTTPLATGHKFNGFFDAFLNNGGNDGLQDLYVYVSPALPFALRGSFIYHRFWSAEGGRALADEYDFVLSRPIGKHLTVLTKGAFFESSTRSMPDGWRYWLEITLSF